MLGDLGRGTETSRATSFTSSPSASRSPFRQPALKRSRGLARGRFLTIEGTSRSGLSLHALALVNRVSPHFVFAVNRTMNAILQSRALGKKSLDA
jgi:hypothetical protein